MNKSRLGFYTVIAGALGFAILHFQTVNNLRAQLHAADEERARLRAELAALLLTPADARISQNLHPDNQPGVNPAQEPTVQLSKAEVLRLRGLANRAIRAEAEVEHLKSSRPAEPLPATTTSPVPDAPGSEKLAAFLGEPVVPPLNLDPAYTKDGLISAIQAAAREAGVSVKKVKIDTSEFPYLAGVVCDSDAEFERIKARLKATGTYDYKGAVSSHGRYAFDITPSRTYPPEAHGRIAHRTMVREQLFFSQLESASN